MTHHLASLTRPTVASTAILTGATTAVLAVEAGVPIALAGAVLLGSLSALITRESR